MAVLAIRRERNGPVEIEIDDADLVEGEDLGGHVLERVDIDLIFGRLEHAWNGEWTRLDQIGAAGKHLLVIHPQDAGLEFVGDGEWRSRRTNDIAAADIDFVLERDGHRLAGDRGPEIAVIGDDAV